jgi:hypothetical protein
MKNKVLKFILFATTAALLIVSLMLFNWVPQIMQKDTMRRYASIEDVRRQLSIKNILVPSYFPQDLAWPPAEILAQRKPFIAIVMEFNRATTGNTELIISQAASEGFEPVRKVRIEKTLEKTEYLLKGRKAVLDVGTCRDDNPCSSLSWKEGENHILVVMKSNPFELIKVSESMLD